MNPYCPYLDGDLSFGIIEIPKSKNRPHVIIKDYGRLDFAIIKGVRRINATVNDAGEKAFRNLRLMGACQKIGELNGFLGVITKVLHFCQSIEIVIREGFLV